MAQPKIEGTGHGRPVMAFGSDGTDWYALLVSALGKLQVEIDASVLPTDAATQTTLALCLTALQKIDDLQGALASEASDRLRVESKSGDKIFGFESVVAVNKSDIDLDAGTNVLVGTVVPSEKVQKLTTVMGVYYGTPPSSMLFYISGLAGGIIIWHSTTIESGHYYIWNGEIYLEAGDYPAIQVTDATAGDDLHFRYGGVQMNAP